jgi:HPt (histidine-containing phosphotransfer) domain-containing protein
MGDPGQFDPAALARVQRIGGAGLVRQLVETFLAHAPTRLEAVRAAAGSGDWDAVRRAAHALKGSAGNVGALGLMGAAGRLEAACADATAAAELVPPLEGAWAEAREHLARVVEALEA